MGSIYGSAPVMLPTPLVQNEGPARQVSQYGGVGTQVLVHTVSTMDPHLHQITAILKQLVDTLDKKTAVERLRTLIAKIQAIIASQITT